MKERRLRSMAMVAAILIGAACSGSDAVIFTNSMLAANAAIRPPFMRAVDGIPGWKRIGEPERFTKEGLYGHIDGGAEIVLQYGFLELSVFTFKPAADPVTSTKEVVLEIYRMASGQAAFGLYSTNLEGEEDRWPGLKPDHWIVPGQANLVKGEYVINILAPECPGQEIGEFMSALDRKVPAPRTEKPKGMKWLPGEGQVPGSGRYIKGALAAQNESPFLEQPFWGFGTAEEPGAAEAYSAKYGVVPTGSKLVIVKFKKAPDAGSIAGGVRSAFEEYLSGVKVEDGVLEGRNQAGRWFLFEARGDIAALVLGEPDPKAARSRLAAALANASR